MNKVKLFFIILWIIAIVGFILEIIWMINILPKQIEFDNQCKAVCLEENMGYDTDIGSGLFEVNGVCYCKKVYALDKLNATEKK